MCNMGMIKGTSIAILSLVAQSSAAMFILSLSIKMIYKGDLRDDCALLMMIMLIISFGIISHIVDYVSNFRRKVQIIEQRIIRSKR